MVFAYDFSGLIARPWSTEAQGNIPAFRSYGTEREENIERPRRRRREFWAGNPHSPLYVVAFVFQTADLCVTLETLRWKAAKGKLTKWEIGFFGSKTQLVKSFLRQFELKHI